MDPDVIVLLNMVPLSIKILYYTGSTVLRLSVRVSLSNLCMQRKTSQAHLSF